MKGGGRECGGYKRREGYSEGGISGTRGETSSCALLAELLPVQCAANRVGIVALVVLEEIVEKVEGAGRGVRIKKL